MTQVRIMEVDEVDVRVFTLDAHDLFAVHARGRVPTTGWTNISLAPYLMSASESSLAPLDGLWDFDFVGTVPTGIVAFMVLPFSADIVLPRPTWLKGVRVYAKDNSKEALIGSSIQGQNIGGPYPWPWPWAASQLAK
jgi:hypothetical protein